MALEVARCGMGGRWACRTADLGGALPHRFLRLCAVPDALLFNPLPVLGSSDRRRQFAESHRGLRGIEKRSQTTLVYKLVICHVGSVGSLAPAIRPLREVVKSVAETKRKKIRWWLIALAALTFLADFAIPWTAERVVLLKFTMRQMFFVVGIFFVIAAFPGYEFLLRSQSSATDLEDSEDE